MNLQETAILVLLAVSVTLWLSQRQLVELLKDALAIRRKK